MSVIDRMGERVGCMFGRGGGRCPIVFLAGVCILLLWYLFRFWCLLGQGGGRNWVVE